MRYIIDSIEDGKIIMRSLTSKKKLVKDSKNFRGVVIGDIIFYDEEEDIREELNDILERDDINDEC